MLRIFCVWEELLDLVYGTLLASKSLDRALHETVYRR